MCTIKCITIIDGTTIDEAEDLNLFMPTYNLIIEYSLSYFDKTGSLRFHSKDEATNFNASITNTDAFKSFNYRAKLILNTVAQPSPNATNEILENVTIVVILNYLSNLRQLPEMPLINCKAELKLKLTKHCVLSVLGNDDADANSNNIIFTIQRHKIICLWRLFIDKRQPKTIKHF